MRRPTNLRKRGANWYGRWRDKAGRRHERRFGPNLAEARRLLAELERNARFARAGLEDEIGQGGELQPLVVAYLTAHEERWTAKYQREVRTALAEILDGIATVRDLTAGAVESARDRLPGSARTKNKKAAWVVGFARWLRRTGRARPPLEGLVAMPKRPVRVRRALTPAEGDALIEHGGQVADLVALLLGTGLRLDEALRLSWRDVGPGSVHVATSKNGTARTVPIRPELGAKLAALRLSRGADADGPVIVGPRFSGRLNARTGGSRLLRWLREATARAGVSPVGVDFHALRHTFATRAADAGATVPQLMALMGWKSVSMAAIYVHRESLDLSGVVARMGQGGGKIDAEAGNRTQKAVKAGGF